MLAPKQTPDTPVPHLRLPPSKWDVFTSIRRTQMEARLAWLSSKAERGPCIGVAQSSWMNLEANEVVECFEYSYFVKDAKSGLTIIPSFDVYARLWLRAEKINPFSFHFWFNSVTMQNSKWFLQYYSDIMSALDEQIIIWGADEPTRNSRLYLCIVAYVEALRLLIDFI